MELKYFKIVIDGYIWSVGKGSADIGIPISAEEYQSIIAKLDKKPDDTNEYRYLLKDSSLRWTKTDAPRNDEISAEEALDIITGVIE